MRLAAVNSGLRRSNPIWSWGRNGRIHVRRRGGALIGVSRYVSRYRVGLDRSWSWRPRQTRRASGVVVGPVRWRNTVRWSNHGGAPKLTFVAANLGAGLRAIGGGTPGRSRRIRGKLTPRIGLGILELGILEDAPHCLVTQ